MVYRIKSAIVVRVTLICADKPLKTRQSSNTEMLPIALAVPSEEWNAKGTNETRA